MWCQDYLPFCIPQYFSALILRYGIYSGGVNDEGGAFRFNKRFGKVGKRRCTFTARADEGGAVFCRKRGYGRYIETVVGYEITGKEGFGETADIAFDFSRIGYLGNIARSAS